MIDWSAISLCTDGDIVGREASWPQWTNDTDQWRAEAKLEIENRLRHQFRERELMTTAPDVLDLIANPQVLKVAAVYMALHLCAENNIVSPQDTWAMKAKTYGNKFDPEFDRAVEMIEFDEDESGTIEDSEKYQVTSAVRFGRGGPPLTTKDEAP